MELSDPHVTPRFRELTRKLEYSHTDSQLMAKSRAFRRTMYRSNQRKATPYEIQSELVQVANATDEYSINCFLAVPDNKLCVGDEILFPVMKRERDNSAMGRWNRKRIDSTRARIQTAIVDYIALAPNEREDLVTLRFPDESTQNYGLRNLMANGVWRKPWADEDSRSGIAAIKMMQRMAIIEDDQLYSETPTPLENDWTREYFNDVKKETNLGTFDPEAIFADI